ncbi:glycosyltransferase [Siccirubricoccus sp. KC 17139]|uniref:Glycosyltransferase n=1 Tax=Siccirubricoccus soli TaxID=2899147 RepID=A0ABT1D902_9PROT|nr:glycosyltransferase [Siccirubricoccus soli]MCO6418404.1 glycosyltransferase [Siccirubricoccus soli]MCP2684539.1 glycosyltransferase [Siccirubricoccus soli]
MKLAIIHDSIGQYGGAEKVLEEMHAAFPDAPVFLPLWNEKGLPPHFRHWDVHTSWLDRMPGARRLQRAIFPLHPIAMHGFDLSEFDVVLSSSFNFAHNVVVGPEATHICYCHSPGRFLWDFHGYAERERMGRFTRGAVTAMLPLLRTMDAVAAMRVDHWIATSRLVQQRIGKYYRRDSQILPPPIRVADFRMGKGPGEHFLLLMRLVGWKRADIAIEACNRLKLPLVVAGDGRDTARLRAMAGPTIRFVGRVDGEEKAALYARSTALILPAVEDFGITPLESMAAGRPVIALGAGGALDTVRPGVTGEFFPEQNAESLIDTLTAFRPQHYDSEVIRAHAETFDAVAFRAQLKEIVAAHAPAGPRPPRPAARLPPAELAARPAG